MKSYVFVNKRPFPVGVPTPSGGSQMLYPGLAVEGDYFISCYQKGTLISLLSEKELDGFDKTKIVLTHYLEKKETTAPVKAEVKVDIKPEHVMTLQEQADLEQKSVEETIIDSMREGSGIKPTNARLIERMKLKDLQKYAKDLEIDTNGVTKNDLIELIKIKQGLL